MLISPGGWTIGPLVASFRDIISPINMIKINWSLGVSGTSHISLPLFCMVSYFVQTYTPRSKGSYIKIKKRNEDIFVPMFKCCRPASPGNCVLILWTAVVTTPR
jgi:hypothetical protein